MGDLSARGPHDDADVRAFTRALMRDLRALEILLERGAFETGRARYGVEQEMYLVTSAPPHRPAPIAPELLAELADPHLTAELASFNLEANLAPAPLAGGFLTALEAALRAALGRVERAARERGAQVVLAGILPHLHERDLERRHMTPSRRYAALDDRLERQRGEAAIRVFIRGLDTLDARFDSIMVESANCSLQLHLQTDPERFPRLYNLAQALSAPLVAAAGNSPVLLGQRLWHETRVALFEASADSRSPAEVWRGTEPRVAFGSGWVRESALEVFREIVLRYRVLLTADVTEDPLETLARGGTPRLAALCLHNGTVWPWNRACYGVLEGRPHLRIENRVLPAGPTLRDEVANAALYYGLLAELDAEGLEVASLLDFDTARANLTSAARYGLDARLGWLERRKAVAADLLRSELVPAARRGLARIGCEPAEIDLYLGVIEERVASRRTGSQWVLDSLAADREATRERSLEAVVEAMVAAQETGEPVHRWPLAQPPPSAPLEDDGATVRTIMSTDLHTVRPEDAVDLAIGVMQWRGVHHVPVEDAEGRVAGVISAHALVRLWGRGDPTRDAAPPAVQAVMDREPATIDADAPLEAAASALLRSGSRCLLAVSRERLVGIVTERDLLRASWPRQRKDDAEERS